MQEITIQKWIDFYKSNKSMTKFISLIKKEDLMLLSYTPENLVLEEGLPEFGILEEDVKSILYQDVRLQNKLLFAAEERDIYSDMSSFDKKLKVSAEIQLNNEIEEEEDKLLFKIKGLLKKMNNLSKTDDAKEKEDIGSKDKDFLNSSKRLLEIEGKIKKELEDELKSIKGQDKEIKDQFFKEILQSKTRLVIALYHGVDYTYWQDKYGSEFKDVLWTSVIQGEYEIYGYDYASVIKKLIERKLVSPKELFDYSLPRGVLEGERYPVPDMPEFPKIEGETEDVYKERRKKLRKQWEKKELKKVEKMIKRKVFINELKIKFGL